MAQSMRESLLGTDAPDPAEDKRAKELTSNTFKDEDDIDRKFRWKPVHCDITLFVVFCILGISWSFSIGMGVCKTIYFLIVTLMTVGYGDVVFKSESGRLFGILYVGIGAILIGSALSNILGCISADASESDDADWERVESGDWKKEDSPLFEDRASAIQHIKRDHLNTRKGMWSNVYSHLWKLAVLLAVGTVLMRWLEGWTVVSSLYFCLVTVTTVGYGELVPTTVLGRAITAIFILISVYFTSNVIGILSSLPVDLRREKMSYRVLAQFGFKLDVATLKGLWHDRMLAYIRHGNPYHADPHRAVTMPEFVLWLLIKQRKVDSSSVETAMRMFHIMDVANEGVLDLRDAVPSKSLWF